MADDSGSLDGTSGDPRREEIRRDLKRRNRRRNRLIVLVGVAVITALLGVANRDNVELEYLFGDAEISLVWVILGAFGAGAVFERAYTFVRGLGRSDR